MQEMFYRLGWSPGIGDPTFAGWLVTVAYFACALKCLQVHRRAHTLFTEEPRPQGRLWLALGGTLIFLSFNKQLDLQTIVVGCGRLLVDAYALQEYRQLVKLGLVLVVIFFGVAAGTWIYFRFRAVAQQHKYAIMGIFMLLAFVALRAATFNGFSFMGRAEKFEWLLELLGISMIWLNARYFLALHRWRSLNNANGNPPA